VFGRASDGVLATLAFQCANTEQNAVLTDDIRPEVRIGIALGEVVVADNTVTGPGVVLAQRIEQLAESGGLCISAAINEAVPRRLPVEIKSLGDQSVKGFDEPVRVYSVRLKAGEEVPEPANDVYSDDSEAKSSTPMLALPDKPSIAVLPFTNLSDDPEQEYFSDGITEDIIIELSKFRTLSVIARNSSFTYKNKHSNIRTVGDQLGVEYIVEGSVRRSRDRVRITAQLVETSSGVHVWAHRYDRELKDIFDVQDEVTQMIVATVGGRLEDHRTRVKDRIGSKKWNAYDLILRAQAHHYRILKSSNAEARVLLERAMEIDSDNARLHSLSGAVELLDYVLAWAQSPQETLESALRHGRKSIQLDNSDSLAHARLGETLIHLKQLRESKRHFDKALELNPNDSEARALYSVYLVAAGDPEQALAELETVRKIDPFERVWIPWLRGEALFLAERYMEAIESFEEVTEPINDLRATLAACYAQTGQFAAAKKLVHEYLAHAREEMPNFPGARFLNWIDFWRKSANYTNDKNHQLFLEAIRKAWSE
jgi:adenylate cyclase